MLVNVSLYEIHLDDFYMSLLSNLKLKEILSHNTYRYIGVFQSLHRVYVSLYVGLLHGFCRS
jgi:hypothetical protein